jgi:N-carbamoylputrescine amidase
VKFGAAAIQLCASGTPDENRAKAAHAIQEAAQRGSKIVVVPELVNSGYVLDERVLRAAAEPIDGQTASTWRALAEQWGIFIVGGICEIEDGNLYNAAILVGPDGVALHYRKLHLFDREKLIFRPGNRGLHVTKTDFGCIGVCVCYDLRFVEVARSLALQGADVIAVPTAWVSGFDAVVVNRDGLIGQAAGAVLQANLNQTYLICASQSGSHGTTNFLGCSVIADPFGSLIAGPADQKTEQTLSAQFDLSSVQVSQKRAPLITPRADRRTDVYRIWPGDKPL